MQGADKQARGCRDKGRVTPTAAAATYLQAGSLGAGNRLCLGLSGVFSSLTASLRRRRRPRAREGRERIELPKRRAPPPRRRVPGASARSLPPAGVSGPPLAPALYPADPRRAPPRQRLRAPAPAPSGAARATQPSPPARSSRLTKHLPPLVPTPSPHAPHSPPPRPKPRRRRPRPLEARGSWPPGVHSHITISDRAEDRTSEKESRPGGRAARSRRPLLRRTAIQTAPSPAFLAPFIPQNVPSSGNSAGSAHQWLPPAFGTRP